MARARMLGLLLLALAGCAQPDGGDGNDMAAPAPDLGRRDLGFVRDVGVPFLPDGGTRPGQTLVDGRGGVVAMLVVPPEVYWLEQNPSTGGGIPSSPLVRQPDRPRALYRGNGGLYRVAADGSSAAQELVGGILPNGGLQQVQDDLVFTVDNDSAGFDLVACALGGCTTSVRDRGNIGNVDLAGDGNGLYGFDDFHVWRLAADDGGEATLYNASDGDHLIEAVAVDEDSVYLSIDSANGLSFQLLACPKDVGCTDSTTRVLASRPQAISRIRVSGDRLYLRDNGTLWSCAKSDGSGVVTLAIESPTDYAVDGSNVYWTDFGSVQRRAVDGSGSPTVVVDGLHNAGAIAVSGSWVYWVEYDVNSGLGTSTNRIARAPQ